MRGKRFFAMVHEIACDTWWAFKVHLEGYIGLKRQNRSDYIFRGQANAQWPLEATIDRQFPNLDAPARVEKLTRLLDVFARELRGVDELPFPRRSPRVELWARHYGLPTTVSDWSESPYVAAFFAFEGCDAGKHEQVAIWTLDQRSIAEIEDYGEIVLEDDPEIENTRIIEQRGVWTRVNVSKNLDEIEKLRLWKYVIPASEKQLALRDLDEMLITNRALFRSSDAVAKTAILREELD